MADSANISSNVVSGSSVSSNLTSGSSVTTNVVESTSVTSNVVTGGVGPTGATGANGADGSDATGNVTKVGTPVDNQIGIWTGDGTIEGLTNLTFNAAALLFLLNSAIAAPYMRIQGVNDGDNFGAMEIWNGDGSKKWQFAHTNNGNFTFNHYSGGWAVPFAITDGNLIKLGTTGTNSSEYFLEQNADQLLVLQRDGGNPTGSEDAWTLLEIKAPDATSSGDQEATLALTRNLGGGNSEFLDVYNNGYSSETQHGIRVQKRGTGVYRDFVIDFYDGSTKETALTISAASGHESTFNGNVNTKGLISTVTGYVSTVPVMAIVDSSLATQSALIAKNFTNYAHSGDIAKFQLLNATDTGAVLKLENAGSGNYITADSVFSVSKTGVVTATNIPTAWTTWVPTFTGFSADPTGGIYNYRTVGNEIEIEVVMPNNGTSNATGFTMTLPVTAATVTNMEWLAYANCANNGAIVNTPCPAVIASAGTVITFWISPNRSTTWGSANGKRCAYLRMSYRWQ